MRRRSDALQLIVSFCFILRAFGFLFHRLTGIKKDYLAFSIPLIMQPEYIKLFNEKLDKP
jgi:hypothetical protein